MLSECLIVRCHRCDNGVLSNLECIELHVRVPPPAPTGRCILFTLANRLPRLTNLIMHDSANVQRCSIDRSVQGGFWAIASQTGLLRKPNPTPERNGMRFPRGPKQPPAPRQNDPFPPSHAEHPRSVPGCRHNRNVPSCRQHFAATTKARAGNKCHLRGLGGRSQRHVIETHISYGVPSSTDTRCPPAYQTMKLAIVLDNRRNAGKVQIQRDDRHDNDHCCDQFVVQMRKHLLAAPALAHNVDGNGRGK